MKSRGTVIAAGTTIFLGWWLGLEAILDRLGYVTFVLPLLPLKWQSALVSDPVLIWAAAILFLVAIALLWSVALSAANEAGLARKSNKKAWRFEAEFAGLRDDYQQVLDELRAIRAQETKLGDQIAEATKQIVGLRADNQNALDKLKAANRTALAEEVARAERAYLNKLSEHHDHSKILLKGEFAAARADLEGIVNAAQRNSDTIITGLDERLSSLETRLEQIEGKLG